MQETIKRAQYAPSFVNTSTNPKCLYQLLSSADYQLKTGQNHTTEDTEITEEKLFPMVNSLFSL